MTNTLQTVLDSIGFSSRPQQERLYQELLTADRQGVVAQAGTGTGKSLAVLTAAVDWHRKTEKMSLVVVPTNVLMDQYLTLDAPRVAAATGARIESLKGRNRYLCESANGFSTIANPPRWVQDDLPQMRRKLSAPLDPWASDAERRDDIFEPDNTTWFGCPGSDECDADLVCHYRIQKERAQAADVVVTNSHLLIIDNQIKRAQAIELEQAPCSCDTDHGLVQLDRECPKHGEGGDPPVIIFPRIGVVLVDECHVLEESLREFATRSIAHSSAAGYLLGYWIQDNASKYSEPTAVPGDADLAAALQEMADVVADWPKERGKIPKKIREASEASAYVLARAKAKAYSSGSAVLYIDPAERWSNKQHKLVSTQIDMSLAAAGLLTTQPFAMVSATVPKSLRNALGIPDARFLDVGHPFDYRRQAKIGISRYSGAWKVVQSDRNNVPARAEEIREQVEAMGGGALLLFPSYRDLEAVYKQIAGPLHLAGYRVLKQERDSNKALLGAQFKADGNAVLFGTESFATGFDAPGSALRLVSIWKLPYPGLDPLTRAISNRDYSRYQDMMLTKVAQAAGRLIRTSDDVGEIWIADSRAQGAILGTGDPMLKHFDEFQLVLPERQLDLVEMN